MPAAERAPTPDTMSTAADDLAAGSPPAFAPEPAVAPVSFRALDQQHALAYASEAEVRRMLNALGITVNLVTALIQHPGATGEHTDLVQAAQAMLRETDRATHQLVESLGMGRTPWAPFRVMNLMTAAVADRWNATARGPNGPQVAITDLMPVWIALAKELVPASSYDEPPDDDAVALQIALLDGLRPVLSEIIKFDLFHDPAEAAQHARRMVVSAASTVTRMLLPDGVSDRSRQLMQQALLRNAGRIYAASWQRHAETVLNDLKGLDPIELEARVLANPGGLSLAAVDEAFTASFGQLTDMALFLVHPDKTTAAPVDRAEADPRGQTT